MFSDTALASINLKLNHVGVTPVKIWNLKNMAGPEDTVNKQLSPKNKHLSPEKIKKKSKKTVTVKSIPKLDKKHKKNSITKLNEKIVKKHKIKSLKKIKKSHDMEIS